MSSPTPSSRSAMAEQIMDVAENLMQTRGYNGFSYQDVSEAVGIRKASIHYHFPAKSDLGAAVLDRYAGRFGAALAKLNADEGISALDALNHYAGPYLEFARGSDRVCLCGALAGEFLALPSEMRAQVEKFFEEHQRWLATIIARGQKRGEFLAGLPARETARGIFSMLQGALLVQRATGDAAQLTDALSVIRRQLTGREAAGERYSKQ